MVYPPNLFFSSCLNRDPMVRIRPYWSPLVFLYSAHLSVSFIFLAIMVRNSGKSKVPLPSASTSLIMSYTSSSVGFCPSDLITWTTNVAQIKILLGLTGVAIHTKTQYFPWIVLSASLSCGTKLMDCWFLLLMVWKASRKLWKVQHNLSTWL